MVGTLPIAAPKGLSSFGRYASLHVVTNESSGCVSLHAGCGGNRSPAPARARYLHAGASIESADAREGHVGPETIFRQTAFARRDARVRELSRSQAGVFGWARCRAWN